MKRVLLTVLCIALLGYSYAQTNVQINPSTRYQQIEGWGGSLCWWANISGGWSDAQITEFCTWLTDPNGANMNIFRFNIGGGDAPDHHHMRTDGGAMPGYKASAMVAYDWAQDANQRRIMLKLKSLRSDVIFEGFSNSPPYWMTKSGCAAGNTNGSDNLRDDQYDEFADYLTEVTKFYKNTYGITFRTLDPFNEPYSTWWKANGGQEGCKFSQGNQEKMIRELYASLSAKGMLSYTSISAMDANSLDQAYDGINGYINAGDVMAKISQMNAHSYSGSSRIGLYTQAMNDNKRLWQSESGPLNVGANGLDNHLVMAQRIVTDLREMKPTAWIDWQLMANNDAKWGLIQADYAAQTYQRAKSYYIRMQCSRFLKQGYTLVETGDSRSLAAINPANNELVVVIVNEATAAINYNLDLGLFTTAGTSAAVYRTSATEDCASYSLVIANKNASYSAPAKSITTLVVPVVTCSPMAITPYLQINGGAWQQARSATVNTGGSVKLGPWPYSGGSWNWTGPNGFSATTREIIFNNISGAQQGTYVATHTNASGCKSVSSFVLNAYTAIPAGTYRILARHSGKALSVRTSTDAAVRQTASTGAITQQWKVAATNSGYYSIMAVSSNKALDISGNSPTDGASILQYTYSGANNQQFKFVDVGAGHYRIVSRSSGKCLDVSGASLADTTVIQWSYVDGTNQQWNLTQLSVVRVSDLKAEVESSKSVDYLVFPNPVGEKMTLTIRQSLGKGTSMQVYNTLGNLVRSYAVKSTTDTYDLSGVKAGTYYIRIVMPERVITRQISKL